MSGEKSVSSNGFISLDASILYAVQSSIDKFDKYDSILCTSSMKKRQSGTAGYRIVYGAGL